MKIANELNGAENKAVFKVDVWRNLFIALLLLSLAGFIVTVNTNNPLLLLAAILGLFGLCIYVQLAIGNYVKSKDIELNTGASYSNGVSVVLLWLVANIGVAYMQSGINRVIQHERSEQSDTSVTK